MTIMTERPVTTDVRPIDRVRAALTDLNVSGLDFYMDETPYGVHVDIRTAPGYQIPSSRFAGDVKQLIAGELPGVPVIVTIETPAVREMRLRMEAIERDMAALAAHARRNRLRDDEFKVFMQGWGEEGSRAALITTTRQAAAKVWAKAGYFRSFRSHTSTVTAEWDDTGHHPTRVTVTTRPR